MKKHTALNLAIDALAKVARENWGWSAQVLKEDRRKWQIYMDAIKILKELRDGKGQENGR